MTLEFIALLLLSTRILSMVFVLMVLVKQINLFRKRVDSSLSTFRMVMFLLALVLFLTNLLPIVVDYYYAFIDPNASRNPLLESYAINNALGALAGSVLLWQVYNIAGKQIEQEAANRLDK